MVTAALGITGCIAAAVDLTGEIIDKREEDLEVALGPLPVLERVTDLLDDLIADNGLAESNGAKRRVHHSSLSVKREATTLPGRAVGG